MDEKKLDEILKNTKQTNMILETIGMTVNTVLVGLILIVLYKGLFHK